MGADGSRPCEKAKPAVWRGAIVALCAIEVRMSKVEVVIVSGLGGLEVVA